MGGRLTQTVFSSKSHKHKEVVGKPGLMSDPEGDSIIFSVYKPPCDLMSLSLGNRESFQDEKAQAPRPQAELFYGHDVLDVHTHPNPP